MIYIIFVYTYNDCTTSTIQFITIYACTIIIVKASFSFHKITLKHPNEITFTMIYYIRQE